MKTLRVVLFLALTGCTSASKMPVRPEMQRNAEEPAAEVVLGAEVLESLPEGSWRYKITEAAKSEWQYFGQQLVVIDGYDESIPHVGIWEDEDDSHRASCKTPSHEVLRHTIGLTEADFCF